MIQNILYLLLGLSMIIFGANFLTDGSASLAKRFKIPELIVGLTIIAIGTSAPELVVSILASSQGSSDIAIGNVVGSNIFNILVVIGLTATLKNIRLSRNNIKKDIFFTFIASIIFAVTLSLNKIFGIDMPEKISRVSGVVFLMIYFGFIISTIFFALKKRNKKTDVSDNEIYIKRHSIAMICLLIFGGLLGLVYGGDMFLNSAKAIAHKLGVKDSIIAITLMAGGTSFPELAACFVAAKKGKTQMALGNVIGSNVANIFLVLGTSAVVSPLYIGTITTIDISMVVISSLLLFISAFTFKHGRVDRAEGLIYITLYISYITYLILHQ
ncbi:MAG: calcium/sodium antiporter [Bacteroidetes bacterium]|nr:calcium/sodium antiporter [Bacteroidota bacterium]